MASPSYPGVSSPSSRPPLAPRQQQQNDGNSSSVFNLEISPTLTSSSSSSTSSSPTLLPLNSQQQQQQQQQQQSDQQSHQQAGKQEATPPPDPSIYLAGPRVYTCGGCRVHFTSHDDIISKSFHGKWGRSYLFDQCVNITLGPAEDRMLMTGLHSVRDIMCSRCGSLVGWTYDRAYEESQKYKEGKFILEKMRIYLEESDYGIGHPAGERNDRWRKRSMSWGTEEDMVYEYESRGGEKRRGSGP